MQLIEAESQGLCKQCGACCRCIVIPEASSTLRQWDLENRNIGSDYTFVLHNWKELTYDEAIKINPLIERMREVAIAQHHQSISYWTCLRLENNKCSVHDEKPFVCRGFPFYGVEHDFVPYSKHCGYWESVSHRRYVSAKLGGQNDNAV